MQVWNKNRINPQPSTKNLTDEELKQQYGIHLTSRLQADGDGKEAKWADIDDDEDDWAPETIEWNDGTKSTLTDLAPTTQKPQPEPPAAQESKPAQPIKILAPQFSTTIGPNATVLKLGASAERQQAQKAAHQQSRGSVERPSSSSTTAPAPTPSKSPWAPLPPVEKVSPVTIKPEMASTSRPPPNASAQNSSSMAAPSAAQEISADDFNRSWRDPIASQGQPRELFMPNSGRYEAVPEGRRRMSRNEPNVRAPALLQRPNQTDQHAPAEPSAAFQTSRTSMDQARRRASSTISGSSGQFARRMSTRSGEQPPENPTSQRDISAVRPVSRDGPPSQLQTPAYQARGPQADYISGGPVLPTDADLEAQRVAQKALMKENIERARRRKIEDEQAEEAKKQERIRQKLASLGPDPRIAQAKVEEFKAATNIPNIPQEPTEKTVEAAPASARAAKDSPPKPPQPLETGEPQQYGMMKVHPMKAVKKLSPPAPVQNDIAKSAPETQVPSPAQLQADLSKPQNTSPTVNGIRPYENSRQGPTDTVNISDPSHKPSKPAPIGAEARAGWGDARLDHRSPPTGNLWGLPNNKALGNGTFDQNLAGYAPQDLTSRPPPSQNWLNGRTPTAARSPQPHHVNHYVADARSQLLHPVTSPDQQPLAIGSEADSMFPTTKPAPIGPPPPQTQQNVNGYSQPPQTNGVTGWHNFHNATAPQERADNERGQRELAARREQEMRTGVRQGPQYTFEETWKQVQLGDQAGQRQMTGAAQSAIPAPNMFGAVGSLPGVDNGSRGIREQMGRGSRFFPHAVNGHPSQDRRAFTYSHPEPPRTPESPSPPPAEEYASFHPAFDGDLRRPVVHFPREKAIVKLPPALPPTPPSEPQPQVPLTWAARAARPPPPAAPPLRAVSTPIVQNPSWQERFNGLLGRGTSPDRQAAEIVRGSSPAQPALAITSSSKEPLDVLPTSVSAAVSLPAGPTTAVELLKDVGLVTSKDVEDEDDLFEDREPGSLPTIHLPRDVQSAQNPKAAPPRVLSAPVEPHSALPLLISNLNGRIFLPNEVHVLMPGMTKFSKLAMPYKAGMNTYPKPRNTTHNKHRGGKAGPPRSRQASSKAH